MGVVKNITKKWKLDTDAKDCRHQGEQKESDKGALVRDQTTDKRNPKHTSSRGKGVGLSGT